MRGTRLISLVLLLGVAGGAWAEAVGEFAQKKKPSRLTVNVVKQKDGSVIERLDQSALPSVARDDSVPGTPAEWLARMIDPTRHGLVVKHPELLAEWLDAVTEPRFMTALATVAMNPETYPMTMSRLADPATARNWSEIANPEVFRRWMAVGMDPRHYQAVFQRMLDPKKYLRWAGAGLYTPALPVIESEKSAPGGQPYNGRAPAPLSSAEKWLQLPTQDPKTNPWLAGLNTYRY